MRRYDEEHECSNCGAVYELGHSLEEDYFKVSFCPFCGEEIVEEYYDEDEE